MVRFLAQGGFSFYGRLKLKNEIDSARAFATPVHALIRSIFFRTVYSRTVKAIKEHAVLWFSHRDIHSNDNDD